MRILYVCKNRCDIHMIRLQHIVFAVVILTSFITVNNSFEHCYIITI